MAHKRFTDEEIRQHNIESTRKWKRNNPEATNEQKKKNYAKSRVNAVNKRQRWTLKDINEILNSPLTDAELSVKLGRSVQAIQIKRAKCKGGYT